MDFRGIAEDTATNTQDLVNYVLALNLSPEDKEVLLVEIFRTTGRAFADKAFADVSLLVDSDIGGEILIDEDNQVARLAQKIVRDGAFELDDGRITKEYYDVLLARAEETAFRNAQSLEKHPTLERRATGRETCAWCEDRVGVFPYPDPELFSRHDDCDCIFIVSGYNSRNGVLKNYKKG